MARKFAIACQAVALPLKTAVQEHLESLGYEVVDLLTPEEQPVVSFTVAAQKIAEAVHETFSNKPWLPFGEPEVVTCAFENDANLIGALRFYQQLKEGH